MNTAWTEILIRYAEGRELCNCREAYYAPADDKHPHPYCRYGCGSNIIHSRDSIAPRLLADTEPPPPTEEAQSDE